jgi:heat shock protein HslJ
MRHVTRSLAILLASLVLAGCGGAPAPEPGLGGRTFLSQAVVEDGANRPLVPGTQIRLDFRDDGQLGASAGCNSIGGTYRLVDGALRFEGGAMTEMGCDPPRHEQDDWLAAFLSQNPSVLLEGSRLALTAGDTTIQLLDREEADPDRPLTGTRWRLDSIRTGDLVASFGEGPPATLEIDDAGTVRITTGCNDGRGQVAIADGTLRFSELALTRKACADGWGEVEQTVLAVLGADAVTYRIDAGSLWLDAGNLGLGYRTP